MRELTTESALEIYEHGLREAGATGVATRYHAIGDDGSRRRLPLKRWLGQPPAGERELLERAVSPVLDIGCGAGRHVAALRERGLEAVGIEISRHAATIARRRGATVIVGSIFDHPLPSIWNTVLLLDGNIGIGGEPTAMLRRVRSLLRGGGFLLVELEPPLSSSTTSRVRLEGPRGTSRWVPWSFVAVDEIEALATAAELDPVELWSCEGRWFARLRREGAE